MKNYDAMILAAGRGARMRDLTIDIPKPLISVSGETLIDRTLDNLVLGGVERVIVNLGYKADILEAHLKRRKLINKKPEIIFSDERQFLLDTGGGVANAIDLFETKFIYIVNSDVIRIDSNDHACRLLSKYWNSELMDFLLLLHPVDKAIGFNGLGDFHINSNGTICRRKNNKRAPFVYAGLSLSRIDQFDEYVGEIFSINRLWDNSQKIDRLYGVVHKGDWFHVGTPEAIAETEIRLEK